MKAAKVSLAVAASVFCFALGISFHASLSSDEAGRDLASARKPRVASPKNDSLSERLTKALRDCAAEPVKNGRVELSKAAVDQRQMSIVSLNCGGERARTLYEAVGAPYSFDEYKTYRDGSNGVVRFFGRLFPYSQCVRLISKPHQTELNSYSCTLQLDLSAEVVNSFRP